MRAMRWSRCVAVLATLGGVGLAAPNADAAGPYTFDAHVDGVAGGGNYSPGAMLFNPSAFEVTFTHVTDSSSVALMKLQQGNTEVPTAVVHETLNGTAVVTLQMSGVRVDDVREDGNANNPNGPEETVVLHCRRIVYTYQPVTPTGQRAGAPVTITYQRGDSHP